MLQVRKSSKTRAATGTSRAFPGWWLRKYFFFGDVGEKGFEEAVLLAVVYCDPYHAAVIESVGSC